MNMAQQLSLKTMYQDLVIYFSIAEQEKIASTEDVFAISERLMKQNMKAYEVLAK